MNKIDWRIAVELVAALSIVISLIFVGLELRQSSSMARLDAYQSFSISISEFARDISHDTEFADLLMRTTSMRNPEETSPAEAIQLFTHYVGLLHLYHGLFQSIEEGLLSTEYLNIIYNDPVLGGNYFRALWPSISNLFGVSYTEFIERTIIESETKI